MQEVTGFYCAFWRPLTGVISPPNFHKNSNFVTFFAYFYIFEDHSCLKTSHFWEISIFELLSLSNFHKHCEKLIK